jgi:predicted alpha/beta-fold hydrolase
MRVRARRAKEVLGTVSAIDLPSVLKVVRSLTRRRSTARLLMRARQARTIWELDDALCRRLYGHSSVLEYYQLSSVRLARARRASLS